jgi:hypothetical protein
MLIAKIENGRNTLLVELPCKRMTMAEHLASIGIAKPAGKLLCCADDGSPIKVKIVGESEFGSKLASIISPRDSLSLVNTACELYQSLPYQVKLDAKEAVLNGKISSIQDFAHYVSDNRMRDTTEQYYCPLIGTVYAYDRYGNLKDYPDTYDGEFLAEYQREIQNLIRQEDASCEENLAEYFDGSNSAVAKLKAVHFGTKKVNGVLYGCITADLTEPFTEEEDAEFKDWLEGQCSDGYGEGLEQVAIDTPDGDLYVSFWHISDQYFLLNSTEFDDYLHDFEMGGIQ